MLKRLFVILGATSFVALGADNPPTETSVRELLEVMQVHKLLDTTMSQMDGFMKQAMQQVTQGQSITPEIQKSIDKGRAEAISMMKEILDWHKLEPMYVRVYQKSFTQPEIDGLTAMYKSPAGQTLLTKMPVVMQNTMSEMQSLIQPVIQRIQRTQQEVAAQIQAEKTKGRSG